MCEQATATISLITCIMLSSTWCDASVLLDSTPNNTAEKESLPNGSLRGFDVATRVMDQLKTACSGTVSCADILELMVRNAVSLAKGPTWPSCYPSARR